MGIFLGSRRAKVTSLVQRHGNIVRDVNSSDMVVSATRFLADMLSRNGIDAGRIRVIPYGVDIGPYR